MIGGKTREVGRIVEKAISFYLNHSRLVLTETLKASPPRCGNMGSPFGSPHDPSSRINHDTAIDHRYEVGKRDHIENSSRPWSIYAGEEDITVESQSQSFGLTDRKRHGADCWVGRGRTVGKGIFKKVSLWLADVRWAGVKQTIPIVFLNNVEIENRDACDAHSGESFRNNRTYAPGTNDPYVDSPEVILDLGAPS
jgi:hypothetical protein